MRGVAQLLLRISYSYSQLLGQVRFEYVPRTGQVRLRRAITLYSLAANCLLVASVPLLYRARVLQLVYAETHQLHQLLYVGIMLVRVAGLLGALFFNWRRRREFVCVVREFARLQRQHLSRWRVPPAVQRLLERRLVRKFCWGLLADITLWALTLDNLRHSLNWRLLLGISALTLLTDVLNLLLNHYYFAVLSVSWSYAALNNELRRLLQATRRLQERSERHGVFSVRCCQLADELDTLAQVHHQLHALADRVNGVFNAQTVSVLANMFLSCVCLLYLGFNAVKFPLQQLGWSSWGGVFLVGTIVAHHCDVGEVMLILLDMLQRFGEAARLLQQLVLLPALDVRLERCFESFSLQIARNRLVVNEMGMFNFDSPMAFSVFAAALYNSILLVQYQYAYQ